MVATLEFIEGILVTYAKATDANRTTPWRRGNVIELSAESGADVMITADLHGHRRNFNAIRRIADLANNPGRHLVMQEVCHGGPTYPTNGGCMSHAMLEDVAKLKATFPERVHFLLSNHEMAEVTDFPILKSKKMLNLLFRMGLQEVYGPAFERVRKALVEFIESCPVAVHLPGDVWVTHSAPERCQMEGFDRGVLERPLDYADYQEDADLFRMLWGRDHRAENAQAFADALGAKVLIHGHEPCCEGFAVPNPVQVIIDCCHDKGRYMILPLDRALTQKEIVERIQPLAG
ncbi:MAG: hypothetical protein SGJ19_17305 [Planctomycetia bacterium]|nr:hypothetical protein [Planctomycetia bacterium]